MMETINHTWHESPVGRLLLRKHGDDLTGIWMAGEGHAPPLGNGWRCDDAAFVEEKKQLDEYFAGKRRVFELRLKWVAGTEFQRRVWDELTRIPYGVTISYGELSRRIGNPSAVRAVGAANGSNPLSIVVPCHRVIGANGTLTGYGGGLMAKRWLLQHEERVAGIAELALFQMEGTHKD